MQEAGRPVEAANGGEWQEAAPAGAQQEALQGLAPKGSHLRPGEPGRPPRQARGRGGRRRARRGELGDSGRIPRVTVPELPWPGPIGPAARIGLAGELLGALEPITEADPAALLFHLLAAAGSLLGPGPHLMIGDARHGLRIWPLVVGSTSTGKKGTAASSVLGLLDGVEPRWRLCRRRGIASGEAIVHHIRDDTERVHRRRTAEGELVETADTIVGVADKRLLLLEEEFARVLRQARREGTTLSATLREAWDQETLMTTSKTSPETATGAHVTVIGHITPEELLRELRWSEVSNGFANRFLYCLSRRSRRLAFPPRLAPGLREQLVGSLRAVCAFWRQGGWEEGEWDLGDADTPPSEAEEPGTRLSTQEDSEAGLEPPLFPSAELTLSLEARGPWEVLKPALEEEAEMAESAGHPLGKFITRAAPQVLRLAALYAALEPTREVAPRHLEAAREVWRYSVESVRWILASGATGATRQGASGPGNDAADPDRVLDGLRLAGPEGLSRREVHRLLGGRGTTASLDLLRTQLEAAGRIRVDLRQGPRGRPGERWRVG